MFDDETEWPATDRAPNSLETSSEADAIARCGRAIAPRIASSGNAPTWDLDEVKDVLLVASSSRSGSTVLAEILKHSPGLLHLSGELNPFLRVAGLMWPSSGSDSDSLTGEAIPPAALARLRAELTCDIGVPVLRAPLSMAEPGLLERLHRRLCMQWPLEQIAFADVQTAAGHALQRLRGDLCDLSCIARFHALFLIELRMRFPAINPYYYDLDRTLLRALAPHIPLPRGAPSPVIFEEPPFVLTMPMRAPRREEIGRYTLVIKTPSNAYRLDFLRKLFPHARCRILHLTRNPAAAINGLFDGWHHWGFHSHYIGSQLRLTNYAPSHPADCCWWKFDLPPGWRQYCEAPLEQVCAFQWRSAHEAIETYVQQSGIDYHRLRFEDLLSGFVRCPQALQALRRWLDSPSFPGNLPRSVPTTMTTRSPRPRRWMERAQLIRSALAAPATRACLERLDYRDEAWWI